eukprot:5819342-Amphidinium_carterae.1
MQHMPSIDVGGVGAATNRQNIRLCANQICGMVGWTSGDFGTRPRTSSRLDYYVMSDKLLLTKLVLARAPL